MLDREFYCVYNAEWDKAALYLLYAWISPKLTFSMWWQHVWITCSYMHIMHNQCMVQAPVILIRKRVLLAIVCSAYALLAGPGMTRYPELCWLGREWLATQSSTGSARNHLLPRALLAGQHVLHVYGLPGFTCLHRAQVWGCEIYCVYNAKWIKVALYLLYAWISPKLYVMAACVNHMLLHDITRCRLQLFQHEGSTP